MKLIMAELTDYTLLIYSTSVLLWSNIANSLCFGNDNVRLLMQVDYRNVYWRVTINSLQGSYVIHWMTYTKRLVLVYKQITKRR